MTRRLWEKGEPMDRAVLGFCVGDDHLLDERLVAFDVRASLAHAQMLEEQGFLTGDESASLAAALQELGASHARGEWHITREEEDVHTALERRLTQRLGSLGGRIHLGRSRNDQVLAALRLYLLDVIGKVQAEARQVVAALRGIRQAQGHIPLPGYTHLQRAMPSSVDLWAAAFETAIEDDLEGLQGARRRLDKNPLGSAAGYGVAGLHLSRERTRELLGFASTEEPVTAVQLSRGKGEAGLLFELVLLMQDVGRLAADICLFVSAEFSFLKLPPAFTTGSSIMPQKRNPDLFELVRAHGAQLPAELAALLSIPAKMPSGYHRDLQLQKGPLFRSIDRTRQSLAVMAHVLPALLFNKEATLAAMDPSLDATAAANRLVVEEGLPFREAYQRIAAKEVPGKN